MRSFLLNKLVRDKIVANMEAAGQQVEHRVLETEEFLHELKRKLLEEAKEFKPGDPKAPNELADLLEVIEAAGQHLGVDFESLRKLQLKRQAERGGFKNKIYIERVNLRNDDSWVDYYTNEPDRFKEVTGDNT